MVRAAGWRPTPLHTHTHTRTSTLEALGMEEGGEQAWRTGHPLGRTQDARPEVLAPVKATGEKVNGVWGLPLLR